MAGTLSVYAVHSALLRKLAGSGNALVLHEGGGETPPNDPRVLFGRRGDEPELLSALEEIVSGPKGESGAYVSEAHWLGFAEERLCDVHGKRLVSEALRATKLSYVEKLNAALREFGLGLDLERLMAGGGALDLPTPADFPMTGMWDAARLKEAKARYDAEEPEAEDTDLDQLLLDIGEWLTEATQDGRDLVGFYY